jgi:hypothetical protein
MSEEYVKLYTDTNIIINGFKIRLEEVNIPFIIKDKFESARLGGFGESLASVEIHVLHKDLEKANEVLNSYREKISS